MNLGGWDNIHIFRDNVCGKETETHLVPIGDYCPHDCDSGCWCNPSEIQPGYFAHNSMDGREEYEEGRKLQ